MLSTSSVHFGDAPASRRLAKKENDSAWLAYSQTLKEIECPAVVTTYTALTASPFDICQPTDAPELLISRLTDRELDVLDDLLAKSTGFERPADKDATFTSLRYRQRKEVQARAFLTAERMRRRISAAVEGIDERAGLHTVVSRRSLRVGL